MRSFLFFLLLVLIALTSCKKTTVCTGVVFDGTGLPLEGAGVGFYNTNTTGSGDITDSSGRYSISIVADKDEEICIGVGKGFCITQKESIKNGTTNEIDFTLHCFDSDLEITFVNDSTPSGMVYVYFNGPLYNGQPFAPDGGGPQLVPYQTTLVKRFRVVGGQGVWVNWDTDLIDKFKNIDTVYCQNRETTSWTIRF